MLARIQNDLFDLGADLCRPDMEKDAEADVLFARAGEEWLQQRGLEQAPRLAQSLEVDAGWEAAVEVVLRGCGLARIRNVIFATQKGAPPA